MADVKICGINDLKALEASVSGGARFAGFVFYKDSPRFVTIEEAQNLSQNTPKGVRRVGVFVDPSNQELEKITDEVNLDIIQLHGHETPERLTEIRESTNLPVMKAMRIATKYDLEDLEDYETVADWLLFDAKPGNSDLPGGTGKTFDWSLLKGRTFSKPWILSGGLTDENVMDAIDLLNPKVVDVSSGVESEPGQKDYEKIKTFIHTVKTND